MPDAAIATGAADHVVPLDRVAPLLVELTVSQAVA
jgi:chemotaxis response regulator CheB